MPDPHKRIIVDGVDFAGLVQFPRILGGITASLQPPRLIIGLLMVMLLVTAGRVWDQVTNPSIAPAGLLAPDWTADDQAASRLELRRVVFDTGWVPASIRDELDAASPPAFDARTVRLWVEQGYREKKAAMADVTPEQVAADDARYFDVLARIEAVRPRGTFEATRRQVVTSFQEIVRSALDLRPGTVLEHVGDLFIDVPTALWENRKTFTIVYGLLVLLVMTLGGGALARMAACQFAGQQRLRINDAIDFALSTRLRLVGAPLVPPVCVAVGAVAIIGLGLLMAVPWLDVVGSFLYGLALFIGLLLALVIVGYAAALSLLIPAVACENCDAGDAAQRAYAYVAGKPLHRLGYAVVGLFGLALGYLLVSLVAVVTLNGTALLFGTITNHDAISAAGGLGLFDLADPQSTTVHAAMHDRAAAWMISFWQMLVVSLVAAYVIVYYFTASTRIYLLMRRACDGQDIDEIWQPGHVRGTLTPEPEAAANAGDERAD